MKTRNYVRKYMDKLHKPTRHKDKTKYDRKERKRETISE